MEFVEFMEISNLWKAEFVENIVMFFNDSSDFLIFSPIRDISLYPGIRFPVGLPPLSWTSLTSSWDTGDML